MIRPIDIQEKEFSKAVRGYKEDEVNEFLDEITIDLERLLDELRPDEGRKQPSGRRAGTSQKFRGHGPGNAGSGERSHV